MVDKPLSVAAGERASAAKSDQLASPARSDRSSDSEGRPVREKLKETRIDAQGTADQAPSSDQAMADAAPNGQVGEASTSGSDNERGRLRRKRSREDFEDVAEDAKPLGKKHERHTRKKSRDITSPMGSDTELLKKKANGTIAPIAENDGDVNAPSTATSTSRQATPEGVASDKDGATVTSPKNKRKLEQTAVSNDTAAGPSGATSTTTKPEERDTKRPRDRVDSDLVSKVAETTSKIPPGSGFSNTSAASPFATMAPKSAAKPAEPSTKDQPQTSESAFKSSGFGAFASSTASPFAAAAKTTTPSPFGAATVNKLSSFASKPAAPASTSSGFAGLGGATSSFANASSAGGSAFGGSLGGSAFGSVIGGKPGLSTFGGGGSITGLKEKTAPEFGAAETKAASDSEGDDDAGDDQDGESGGNEAERRTSQHLLSSTGPLETGEENEDAAWTGRAKLYTFVNQDGKKSWQERGVGPLKLNVTREEPYKARFVLRADGTHRLLLNVAVTSKLRFGDASGNEPNDGRLLFAAPTTTGEVESHMLRVTSGPLPEHIARSADTAQLKVERAAELWRQVDEIKSSKMYA
ncbi:nuclear protein export protein [Paraphaeosphaeria sporulosa]